MEQYIKKSALVAEIERLKKHYDFAAKEFGDEGYNDNVLMEQCKASACERILSFIDTLEVKEEDLNKEMQAFALLYLEPLKISDSNIGISITMAQLYRCAEHFFELALSLKNC